MQQTGDAEPGWAGSQAEVSARATADLSREITRLARDGRVDDPLWAQIQAELGRRRLARRPIANDSRPSLRALVLARLRESPGSTPTQLASGLQRSTTVVSRVLSELLLSGAVRFEASADDLRVRHYFTTESPKRAGGSDENVQPISDREEERQYLALALASAVRARRRENLLDYASDRLERVLRRAESIEAEDIALLARRELITTLRQAGRSDVAAPYVEWLRAVEVGEVAIESTLFLPALGCLHYEMGRDDSALAGDRVRYLTSAATAFSRCQQLPSAHDWRPREGWALLSIAEIWVDQTEFGYARGFAEQAAEVFAAFDDTYGAAEAARISGFCLRLQGDFARAIEILESAETVAKASVSDRCRADVLLQLGDAYRCIGDLPRALRNLDEAEDIAERMGRSKAVGFAMSSRAAIKFQEGDLDAAYQLAADAMPKLRTIPVGYALNARRTAVVARELSTSSGSAKSSEARDLFGEALTAYQNLKSPAGVAACLLGLGKLTSSNRDGEAFAQSLVAVASSAEGRLLLRMDPWVPSLIDEWAHESEYKPALDLARYLAFESHLTSTAAGEMAGEPRRLSSLAV